MARIGSTDLEVGPFTLGGNVFGWTSDLDESFAVLDAYTAAGGNFVDSADAYSAWVEGNSGGESETILGAWLKARGRRDEVVVATKAGAHPKFRGLGAATVKAAAEESLRRLQTDYIDLYYAHFDDPDTPVAETLGALDELVREGKVRHIAASNFTAERLAESLAHSDAEGLARYVAFQPHYNLLSRDTYEGEREDVVKRNGLSALPYSSLASGFLTGKYRPGQKVQSARAGKAGQYLESERGQKVLAALDTVAEETGAQHSTVALAWLNAQPTVIAPIASARTVEQLPALLALADLELTDGQVALLDEASA
ncbi:aldo/keto reductase [Actinomadura barringtoniae]|uniref:Aldo/keto reductase n=1 Tax=Actinomadura barringtoniae TaxID=1427535 RepID=A0A939PP47_9ACTN|nr:aldo/keto reductase [Actinomadura barringtoniae]MBO2452644.1 aldo/keto reductase [Actinomadura barringtoniae]